MKQDVNPGVIALVAVILVAVIGFAAFKMFGPHKSSQLANGEKLVNAQGSASGGHQPPQKGMNMSSGGGQ